MTLAKSLLTSERKLAGLTIAILIACSISGITIYIKQGHSDWIQWGILAHTGTGIACSLALLPYFLVHFRRTFGFRRTSLLLSGLFTVPLFIGFLITGWHLMLNGQQENQRWVLDTHIITSFIFLLLVIAHLISHIAFLPIKRKTSPPIYASLPAKSLRYIVIFNITLQVLIYSATLVTQEATQPYSKQPAIVNYQYSYGEHPFRPSQTETYDGEFVDPRQIANSHRCLSCHQDIGNQWISSMHQQAASDPSYVTNISLLAEKKGIAATRYCEGCHAPVALLTGQLTPGGKHGGEKNTSANHEGISCMGCHGIESLPHLKGVASYRFKPAADYLFEQSNNPFLMRINNWLIRLKPDQHKKDLGRPILKDPKLCSACHTQFMDETMNDWGWVKMQDEYGAWLNSPYSHQNEEDFSNPTRVRCHDCHMPLETSSDPSSNSEGKIRTHHFPGANTALPLLRNDLGQLDATKEFLQSNKLRVSIETPNRQNALQNLQAIDEGLRNFNEAPYYYYLGETAEISVVVNNNRVGHNFPGGTTDINEAWIEFIVLDAEGNTVFHSGAIDADKRVDPDAYFYKSIPVDRHGKHVWKHDLFNMVGVSFKRVIKAGDSDIVRYQFLIPGWTKPPITITASVKYRKFNQQYAKWALKDLYTDIPVVNMAWDTLQIPIRVKKEVDVPPK